uniref:C-type lectin domain-containing protein n=1 Tax=Plectus sambesii TaxID=2011161 RepID=A0A914UKR9_9BILA
MLFSLAVLLFTLSTVTAQTDLQNQCTGADRVYSGASCYVAVSTLKNHDAAKTSCNHYLGYSGHLVHIRTAAVKTVVKQLATNYIGAAADCVWTGLELRNLVDLTSDINNWGNYYSDGTFASTSTYLPWYPAYPIYGAAYNRGINFENNNINNDYNINNNADYNVNHNANYNNANYNNDHNADYNNNCNNSDYNNHYRSTNYNNNHYRNANYNVNHNASSNNHYRYNNYNNHY